MQIIYISIEDNGKGISKDNLVKIGQSFFTNKKKGTGLGLMVTKNIIDEHEGEIYVESKEGIGTIFTIQLPLLTN